MSDTVLLKAKGLTKSFGAVRVVQALDFEVNAGEVLGVLGPNGAGKTTLFNLISGDTTPDGGQMHFRGRPLRGALPFQRCRLGIGRTYQVPRPFEGMSVFENLLVSALFGARQSQAAAHEHCARILADCGLAGRANQFAGSLALLDRKRLELARALATGPCLLLLDEIAGGLTDEESAQLVMLVRRIRETGVTVVWIEHVLHALMAVADRLLVLNFGQKIADGAPAEVMASADVQRVYLGMEEHA
jgi:branched-chain amino acid transport system ATP-binding protein